MRTEQQFNSLKEKALSCLELYTNELKFFSHGDLKSFDKQINLAVLYGDLKTAHQLLTVFISLEE